MALPNNHQLKFNIHNDAKSLIEAIEKSFGVNVVLSVSAASPKAKVSTLLNVDSLSDVVIYYFFTIGGYDWSFQAEEEPSNYALMDFTSPGSSSFSGSDNKVAPCSKACLESVEARLVVHQQNETVFEEDIKLLKLDVMLRDNALAYLRKKFEKAEKERNDLKLTLEKFQNLSKNLSKLLESQVNGKTGLDFYSRMFNCLVSDYEGLHCQESDNRVTEKQENDMYKIGEGYHVVLPPYTRNFLPPKPDLVFTDDINANESVANENGTKSCVEQCNEGKLSKFSKDDSSPFKKECCSNNNLTRSRLVSLNAARRVTTVVTQSTVKCIRLVKNVFHKAHSPGNKDNTEKASACWVWKSKCKVLDHVSRLTSASMTFKQFDYTDALGRSKNPKGGMIYGKGKIKTGKLDFDDVYFVKDIMFNLFSVSQMCDKKNNVLFKDTKCVVLSSDYKLPDENHVSLRVPRENIMYNVDLKNGVLQEKGKQHRASCKSKTVSSISQPLQRLHIDLFGPTFVKSINKKSYYLVVIDDYSRVLVTKPHIQTAYELLLGRSPGIGPKWLFDIDTLTMSMNNQPVVARNQPNDNVGIKENLDACKVRKEIVSDQQYMLLLLWSSNSQDPKNTDDDVADDAFEVKRDDKGKNLVDSITGVRDLRAEFEEFSFNSTNRVNAVHEPVNAARPNPTNNTTRFIIVSPSINVVSLNFGIAGQSSFLDPSKYLDDPDMPELEDIVYSDDEEDVGAEADLSNLEINIPVSPIPTTRVHKDHPVNQIIGDLNSAPQTRSMAKVGHTQEEGIDYVEVFAPIARIEAIRLFLAYASFMGFMVYQMDIKSDFLYRTIKEDVYVCQPLGFEDPDYLDKVYKLVKALYGLHQAPRAWYETLANYLLENGFQREKID
nr:putative ribonuclease H-like domain-containing protein [Tanacetum cinerariifolium]